MAAALERSGNLPHNAVDTEKGQRLLQKLAEAIKKGHISKL